MTISADFGTWNRNEMKETAKDRGCIAGLQYHKSSRCMPSLCYNKSDILQFHNVVYSIGKMEYSTSNWVSRYEGDTFDVINWHVWVISSFLNYELEHFSWIRISLPPSLLDSWIKTQSHREAPNQVKWNPELSRERNEFRPWTLRFPKTRAFQTLCATTLRFD